MVRYHQGIDKAGSDIRYRVRQLVRIPCFADKVFRIAAIANEADIVGTMHLSA